MTVLLPSPGKTPADVLTIYGSVLGVVLALVAWRLLRRRRHLAGAAAVFHQGGSSAPG